MAKVYVDDTDMKIIEVLQKDSSLSTRDIANMVGIPITTVHNRIKKLVDNKVIKKYTIDVDYSKLGKSLYAFVLATINYVELKKSKRTQPQLAEYLLTFPFVKTSRIVTGTTDMILTVRADDIKDLNRILTTIQGVSGIKKTETLIVLNE